MNEREAFLKLLAENEDDVATRLVYADWLDDCGEYEEAERQRKWIAAREWLRKVCDESSRSDSDRRPFCYEELIAFGYIVAETGTAVMLHDDISDIGRAVLGELPEFYQHWSTVTGRPIPRYLEYKSFYWQCCPNEEYWIGGAPPPPEPQEPAASEPSAEWDRVQDDLENVRRRKRRE